jgi:hypothetical protein
VVLSESLCYISIVYGQDEVYDRFKLIHQQMSGNFTPTIGHLRWRNNNPISSIHPPHHTTCLLSHGCSHTRATQIFDRMSDHISSERSPLLVKPNERTPRFFSPLRRVLLLAFASATSFAFTQTSLIYAFRVMTCDDYFTLHNSMIGSGKDRCSIPIVESKTAKAIAVMSTMTTFCC